MNINKLTPGLLIAFFVLSLIALGTSFALYVYWYIDISSGLAELAQKLETLPSFEARMGWILVALTVLVLVILAGISMTFIYYRKTQKLYRLQNNFINNFTHELKTPVTSLKLYLETFLKHDLSPLDQTRFLNYMVQDVDRLSDNINAILDLGRIETHDVKGEFKKVDLKDFILQFYSENQYLFEDCQIDIIIEPGQDYLYPINESLFEMLLINLTTNAIKYNQSKRPSLSIQLSTDKKWLVIEFIDNGMGIPKHERKNIFKKFYQLGRSEDMSAKGSGLGLYLVQNIIQIHKGKISVDIGTQQTGSNFKIRLPKSQGMAQGANNGSH